MLPIQWGLTAGLAVSWVFSVKAILRSIVLKNLTICRKVAHSSQKEQTKI